MLKVKEATQFGGDGTNIGTVQFGSSIRSLSSSAWNISQSARLDSVASL